MSEHLPQALRSRIKARLRDFSVKTLEVAEDQRAAAVAIVVTDTPDKGPAIIMTRRPMRIGRHPGQYALPGGRIDEGESANTAARRELSEELGVDLTPDDELGRLDDFATRSGFVISPFILWGGPGLRLAPEPAEVEKVLLIPFSELDSEAIPHFQPGYSPDRPVLYSKFPTIGHSMYAPTAAIVYQFREVCLRGQHTRVDHYDQPKFAWK